MPLEVGGGGNSYSILIHRLRFIELKELQQNQFGHIAITMLVLKIFTENKKDWWHIPTSESQESLIRRVLTADQLYTRDQYYKLEKERKKRSLIASPMLS